MSLLARLLAPERPRPSADWSPLRPLLESCGPGPESPNPAWLLDQCAASARGLLAAYGVDVDDQVALHGALAGLAVLCRICGANGEPFVPAVKLFETLAQLVSAEALR